MALLSGIRVLDLGWVMVGPSSARYLADLGADVIKVEAEHPMDPSRLFGPFKDGVPGIERSVWFHQKNAGKRSIALDLKSAADREALLTLCRDADVLIESFRPGVIDTLGLGYAALRTIAPQLIMVSTSMRGRDTGTSEVGIGTLGAALAGATNLVGWPDRAPSGPFGPWTDSVTPRYIVATVLAALIRRLASGAGCYIDVSQVEAGVQFLMPAYFQFLFAGRIPQRVGSAAWPHRAPCGLYLCRGGKRWVAIDAAEAGAWKALRALLRGPLRDAEFDTLVGRLRANERLDSDISAWTAQRDADEVEALLQAKRIPAHVVSDADDLTGDIDLRASGQLQSVDDPDLGRFDLIASQFGIAGRALTRPKRAPRLGEHTERVLSTKDRPPP